jgi:hypothetical protein
LVDVALCPESGMEEPAFLNRFTDCVDLGKVTISVQYPGDGIP